MGFWGSFVVCRPGGELGDVDAITSRDDGVEETTRSGGGWRVGRCHGSALADDVPDFLTDLVAETGAPAVSGFVLDSDCVDIHGFGTTSGHWRACLARDSMSLHLDGPLRGVFLSPRTAVERAAAWAAEAGLVPGEAALLAVFSQLEGRPGAEPIFAELIDALGVLSATTPAPVAPPRRRTARRPTHPLDAFILDFAADVLTGAGFTKKGRTFRYANDIGDVAAVKFRPHADFNLDVGVVHKPIWDFRSSLLAASEYSPDSSDLSSWRTQWGPHRWGGAWNLPAERSEREPYGLRFRELLRHEIVPTLLKLLDRPAFADLLRRGYDGKIRGSMQAGPLVGVQLLADGGPSPALDDMLSCVDQWPDLPVTHWTRNRLAEHGVAGDSWRETVQGPRRRVQAFLDECVVPELTVDGWEPTDLGFRVGPEGGSHVVVDLRLSALATTRRPVFYADAGFLTQAPSSRRFRAEGLVNREEIEPPQAHGLRTGTLAELGVTPWLFDAGSAADAGAELAARISEQIARLTPYRGGTG